MKKYLSLIKFSHTIFAMPFALIGFFLGMMYEKNLREMVSSVPEHDRFWIRFLWVILCMIFARTAAMAFNRYLDRHFDALNARTAVREIPSGQISPNSALWFTILSSLLFILTTLMINRLCFYLSFVALFVILFYSYTKRFTALCHLVLGLGLSLAPIGAFLSVTGVFSWLPILFSLSVIGWVSGFDIIYALQDEAFDREQQLHSIPVALGEKNAKMVSILLHLASAFFVLMAGFVGVFSWLYWIGAGFFCGMLLYQHRVIKIHGLKKVDLAFMTANGIASVVFSFFVIADLIFIQKLLA
jgi:4-hydroxybenzoate polyprenyltransferase